MIRINLLGGGRVPVRHDAVPRPGRLVPLACGALLAAAAGAVGWQSWSLRERSAQLAHELAAADRTLRELAPAAGDLAALEARRASLERRVALIDELRREFADPVRMLDAIGRSVPDGLRLSGLRQSPEGVVVEGRAATLQALSDFVAHLERSPQVAAPIEILGSRAEDGGAGGVVQFGLRARFAAPES